MEAETITSSDVRLMITQIKRWIGHGQPTEVETYLREAGQDLEFVFYYLQRPTKPSATPVKRVKPSEAIPGGSKCSMGRFAHKLTQTQEQKTP